MGPKQAGFDGELMAGCSPMLAWHEERNLLSPPTPICPGE